MRMKVILVTVGWEVMEQHKFLAKHYELGDVILLVADPRGEREGFAKLSNDIGRVLQPFFPDVRVERIEVEADCVGKSVLKLVEAILAMEPDKVIVDVSGGMRALVVEALMAANILASKFPVEVWMLVESAGKRYVKLPLAVPPLERPKRLGWICREILGNVIKKGETCLGRLTKDLRQRMEIGERSVFNAAYRLRDKGLIMVKRGFAHPTDDGYLAHALVECLKWPDRRRLNVP